MYADDFSNERSDRERIQAEKEMLKEKNKACEDELALLKQQVMTAKIVLILFKSQILSALVFKMKFKFQSYYCHLKVNSYEKKTFNKIKNGVTDVFFELN